MDFWVSSGHLLLDKEDSGRLVVTEDFLKAYLARPELVPPEDACPAELSLYNRLMAQPRCEVTRAELAKLEDSDARDNWSAMLQFRDSLLRHGTIEGTYLALMRDGVGQTPPVFIAQLVHLIMRNILDGESDALLLRAGELLFRTQRLTLDQGGILLADDEVVDGSEKALHASPLTAMLAENKARKLDVLTPDNHELYWKRSEQFDMVLDFSPASHGRLALARILERWLKHMVGLEARVTPLAQVQDDNWFWFVGLDVEGTRIGNRLWRGEPLPADALDRVVALFSLQLPTIDALSDKVMYLILGMTPQRTLTLKPQNLLLGLPEPALSAELPK